MGDISEYAAIDRLSVELAEARAKNKDAYELAYSVARHDMEVQLREARAQIAAKDSVITQAMMIRAELNEARAQIAAKDAAIKRYRRALEDICYMTFESDDAWKIARAALAAPAQGRE